MNGIDKPAHNYKMNTARRPGLAPATNGIDKRAELREALCVCVCVCECVCVCARASPGRVPSWPPGLAPAGQDKHTDGRMYLYVQWQSGPYQNIGEACGLTLPNVFFAHLAHGPLRAPS